MKNLFTVDFLKGDILKSILIFSIPLLLSNLFQQLYNVVDTILVGNILGNISLAAIGSTSPIYELLIGFSIGIANGFGLVISRNYGSKRISEVRKTVASSLILGTAITIFIGVFSYFFLYDLLRILNTPDEIINIAYDYIYIILLFSIVTFLYNFFSCFLRAIGNSFFPLIALIISSVLNIILDVCFMFYFKFGVVGASIGTLISQLMSVVFILLYSWKKYRFMLPTIEDFKYDIKLYINLLYQGLSMGFMMSVVSIGTVILQGAINGLGTDVIIAHTASRKISTFAVIPSATISTTIGTFISQNKGAKLYSRINTGLKYANYSLIISGFITFFIMLLLSKYFIVFIAGTENSVILKLATYYLIFNSFFYPVLGVLSNMRRALQSIGKTVVPLLSSVIECLGKILFSYVFVEYMGYYAVIICEPIIWCLMCMQLCYEFYRRGEISDEKKG